MTEDQYTDDADVSQLEQRIDELEETIRQMLPSRREAIGMGVAGLAGASLMSGTASAGSAQVGTIGDNSNLVDLVAEDVTITDTLNTASLSGAATDEALLSDGSGNLTFGSVGGVEEVSTFGNLPAVDPPQLAYVVDEDEYYHSNTTAGAFDLTGFSLDKSISKQSIGQGGITFNNDGTKLFEIGESPDEIYESSLSTPFDIGTASLEHTVPAQGSGPEGLEFNDDGTKLFTIDRGADNINEYSLSTAFDITTLSFTTSISTQDADPRGIEFNNDGTKMFEAGEANKIYESSLGTAYDITSASFTDSVNPGVNLPQSLAWNDSGDKLFVADSTDVVEGDLTTAFDISTATFSSTFSLQGGVDGITFGDNGKKFYELSDKIYQYTIPAAGWEAF